MGILDTFRGIGREAAERTAPPKAIVAAAMPMSGPGVQRVQRSRKMNTTEQWQTEAWYYFDAIGELRGPLVWIANAVSQADLHATDIDPDTGKPTGPSEDVRAQFIATQALGGPQQRGNLLRLLALCWQVAGEAWIVIRPQGAGKPDAWLVLSGGRVKAKGETWQYTDPFTALLVTLGPTDRLIRVWSPHPDDQSRADSAVRPALPICREVEKASQNIAARLDSRLASNGIMLIADEVDLPKGDHPSVAASVMEELLGAAEYSLQNPGQASAQVPLGLNAPGELIANGGAFQHFDLATEFDGQVVDLRTAALGRLAATLDMPKQVAEGAQGEGNHWSDWKVEEDTYKIYIEPLLKAIGDAVSQEWYQPALIADGRTADQAATMELGWDTTSIVARPDSSETLESAYDKNLISDVYFLTEHGIPEDAMPDEEERTRRFLEKVVIGAPTLLADPAVAAALGLNIEIAPVAAGVDAEVGAGGELEVPEPEPVALPGGRGLPNQGDSADGPEGLPGNLTAAAEVLVMQALDRAGGRLLTNQNRGQFKDTPRHELYRHIRPADPGSLVEIKFADTLATAFAVRPGPLRVSLEMYVTKLLTTGDAFDRDELRWYLR